MNEHLLQQRFHTTVMRTVTTHVSSTVYQGCRDDRLVAIKVYTHPESFYRELDCLTRLHARNAPVPQVLDHGELNQAYVLIQTWLPGFPLESLFASLPRDIQCSVVQQSGFMLAKIDFALSPSELQQAHFWHRFDFSDMTEFRWSAYINAQLTKWIKRIQWGNRDQPSTIEDYITQIVDCAIHIPEPQHLTLLHCDYSFRNLILNKQKNALLGVIDFEVALLGDPLYDLAKLAWVDIEPNDQELRQHFIDGWETYTQQEVNMSLFALYQSIQAVAAISWVDKQSICNDEYQSFRKCAIHIIQSMAPHLKRHLP